MRNIGYAQMAGNSSEMTVAQSRPQDTESGGRGADTAGLGRWTPHGLPALPMP